MVQGHDEELATRVGEIDWYHTIDLPGGIRTPGVNRTDFALKNLHLPSLVGKTVLDIGAWDGFYSFEATRRGARRVVAVDSFVWTGRWGQNGFNLARQALGLEGVVEDRTIDVMELSPATVGTFDVVLFLGVLYHLPDPVGALRAVASVSDDLLLLETETSLNVLPFAAARLWPGRELSSDDTNWWSLNRRALEGLLRQLGFTSTRVVYRTPLWRRVARAVRARSVTDLRSARIVIHARR
jgi:tRNA (mo5U34)-methyltransferase